MSKRCLPVVWVILIVLSSGAMGDGKYFAEKAYKKAPGIPTQRAILKYKDGVETLTIESSLEAEGKKFGWVIPLPAVPTEINEASPGLLKTLSLAIQPKITHDHSDDLWMVLILTIVITLFCLSIWTINCHSVRFMLALATVALLSSILMPSLGRGRAAGIDSVVAVRDIQTVGNYHVAILQAKTATDLGQWLESNGFMGLSEEEKAIVSDYIDKNWCFVTAKLQRKGSGFSQPHPIAMSFPVDKPVYPMRLTATSGGPVYLELFVIADQVARHHHLVLEHCDQYRPKQIKITSSREPEKYIQGFRGQEYKERIEHPVAASTLWDGCSVSKLCATLTASQMVEDIYLDLESVGPSRKHYYSEKGARQMVLVWTMRIWSVALLLTTMIFRAKLKERGYWKILFRRAIVPLIIVIPIVSGSAYSFLPRIEVEAVEGGRGHVRWMLGWQRSDVFFDLFECIYGPFPITDSRLLGDLIGDYLNCIVLKNGYSGDRIKQEDSPGNFTIIEDERGMVFRTYLSRGFPRDNVATPLGSELQDNYLQTIIDEANAVIEALLESKATKGQVAFFREIEEYHPILIELYKTRPVTLVPKLLEHLSEVLLSQESQQLIASMLGCISRVSPPLDVMDKEKMNDFVVDVQQWHRQQNLDSELDEVESQPVK